MIPAGVQPYKTDLHPIMPLYVVIFIAFIGYAMMVTIFVTMLVRDPGFFDASVSQSTKMFYSGILLALYPLGQFIGAPIIGSLADKKGRKRVLSITLILSIFFYAAIAYSIDMKLLWVLMGACFLAGLTESNIAICQSAIADISTPDDRGRLFAYLYGIISASYAFGPLFGGQIVVHFKYSTPFWLTAILLIPAYIWVLISFKDVYVSDRKKVINYFETFTNLTKVFTDLPIRKLYLVNFMIYMSIFGFFRVMQMYLIDEWNYSVSSVTLFYAYFGILGTISSMLILAPLTKRYSIKSLTVIGAVLGGLFAVSMVIPRSDIAIWIIALPVGLFLMWALSGSGTYLSSVVEGDRQGRVLGNNLALQVGAESLSAVVGGFLAAILVPLPLITYGIIGVLGGLLLITYKKQSNGN